MLEQAIGFVIWLTMITTGVAAAYAVIALQSAIEDRAQLRARHLNGPRALVASASVTREWIRLIMQAAMLCMAIISHHIEVMRPVVHPELPLVFAQRVFMWLLSVGLVFASVSDRRFRKRLIAMFVEPRT